MARAKSKSRFNDGYGAGYQRKRKNGSVRWYLDYRDSSGKRIQRVAPHATSMEEARLALRRAVLDVLQRDCGLPAPAQKVGFSEFSRMYLDNYAKANKRSWRDDDYRLEAKMKPFPEAHALMFPDGKPLQPGQVLRNPALADVLQAIAHAPKRVFGFVYLNPKYEKESLQEIDRCVHNGPMVGIKLWVAMKLNRPELDPILRRAAELKAPILQHAYWRVEPTIPGESGPLEVAEAAARHPDAKFICAHTGNDWERGIRAIRATKNVCAEVSGFDPTAGVVEMAVRELGAERVIFGSDAGGRSYASQLAKVLSANLSEADNRLVLAENLRRLLQPIAATKGMKL